MKRKPAGPPRDESDVTHPELIARYEALGIPSRDFERLAGLPYKFIDSARAGKLRSAKSAVAWKRFSETLASLEAKRAPERARAPAIAGEEDEVPQQLLDAIKAAKDPDSCAELVDQIGEAMVRGEIDPAMGRVLKELVAEKRQCFKAAAEAEEKARAGEPLEVRVVYVNRWHA